MKHPKRPFDHNGLCGGCGKNSQTGNHENCGDKTTDAKTTRKYKAVAKRYRNGDLPTFMFS